MAEILLRLFAPQTASWLAIYQRHPELPFYSLMPNETFHVDTGETNWHIDTDPRGFRFDPNTQKQSSCIAMWLGDSYAFGQGVNYDESLIGQIDEKWPDIENINTAVGGYGPTQYRRVFEYQLEQGQMPDLLFVATFVGNDFHDTQWSKDVVVKNGIVGNERDLKSTLKQNLHLYRLASSVYHQVTSHDPARYAAVANQLASPEAWDQDFLLEALTRYESEMKRITELAEERDIPLAFVILPTREAVSQAREGKDNSNPTRDPNLPVNKAADILERLNVNYLNATSSLAQLPTEETYFRYDGHLTPRGNTQVAEAFLGQFSPQCDAGGGAPALMRLQ